MLKVSLGDAWPRWLFSLVILLVAGSFSLLATRVWVAEHWADSSRPELWQRAARLEPGNAYYWSKLGQFEQWDFPQGDLYRAVADYERATRINPHHDQQWMNLAEAYEAIGETQGARAAFEKAQSVHPISSEVAWRYGNSLMRQGDVSGAFVEFRRALATSPNLTASAVDECWKATHSPARIVDELLPQESDAYVASLNYFVNQGEVDPALTIWQGLIRQKIPFRLSQVPIPLINELIRQDRVEDAYQVWQQALEATNWPRGAARDSSLVFNGGFEHDAVNGGFDWQIIPVAGGSFEFDTAVVHSGLRSLRITFDGSANLDFQHLLQFVKVESRAYVFAAYVRTEELSTDSGIRFEIFDPRHRSAVDLLTPSLEGTRPWTRVEGEITTPPGTRLLEIVLRRVPSWKFNNKLRGTVWIDDVSLTPTAGVAEADSR